MAINLDMSKAYDGVDCRLLCRMMEKMGFRHQWVKRIEKCISTVRYKILTSGIEFQLDTPTRGVEAMRPSFSFLVSYLCLGAH